MTLTEQFATMIAMTVMGLWLGLALTTYHRFMNPRRRQNWLLLLTDLLFWVFQGLLTFYVLLNINEGQIRFYMFLSLALGFAAYKALFENIYESLLERIIHVCVQTMRFIKRIFLIFFVQPALALLSLLTGLGMIIGRFILAALSFLLSAVYQPFKWLFGWIIPDSLLNNVQNYLTKLSQLPKKLLKWLKSD